VNGLDVPGILALMVDRDGTLWLGTMERAWSAGWGAVIGKPGPPAKAWMGILCGLWSATTAEPYGPQPSTVSLPSIGPASVLFPGSPMPACLADKVISVREAPDRSLWFSSSAGDLIRYSPDHGGLRNWTMPAGLRWIWANTSDQLWGMTEQRPVPLRYGFQRDREGTRSGRSGSSIL